MKLQIEIDMDGPMFAEDPNWVSGYRPAYELTLVLGGLVSGLRTVGMSVLSEPFVLRDSEGGVCGTARVVAVEPESAAAAT